MTGSTIGLGTDENGSLRRLAIVQVRVWFLKNGIDVTGIAAWHLKQLALFAEK